MVFDVEKVHRARVYRQAVDAMYQLQIESIETFDIGAEVNDDTSTLLTFGQVSNMPSATK